MTAHDTDTTTDHFDRLVELIAITAAETAHYVDEGGETANVYAASTSIVDRVMGRPDAAGFVDTFSLCETMDIIDGTACRFLSAQVLGIAGPEAA